MSLFNLIHIKELKRLFKNILFYEGIIKGGGYFVNFYDFIINLFIHINRTNNKENCSKNIRFEYSKNRRSRS